MQKLVAVSILTLLVSGISLADSSIQALENQEELVKIKAGVEIAAL